MHVFIDQSGKYYQAKVAKDEGDAKIEHPTQQMKEYLTETPVTAPEFGRGVLEKETKKLIKAIPAPKKEIVDKDLEV